jgi:anaerobic magnesium-protoporphyrin IX monomethyl ester cyclase
MKTEREQNTILLINPPFYRLYGETYSNNRYPLSLGYMAGTIKTETNWKVFVYDADFATNSVAWQVTYLSGVGFDNYQRNLNNTEGKVWQELKAKIAEYKPRVVGIYCCASNYASTKIIARLVKQINKDTIVIVGGPHPTAVGREILGEESVDIVVKGEGERTIVKLLNALCKADLRPLAEIKGIIYRTGQNVVETPDSEFIDDLDELCFPYVYAHEVLIDFEKHPRSAFRHVLATRGCPYNCFFCGSRCLWGRKTRYRSVENVVEEIKSLQKIGGQIEFVDDTFGTDQKYTHKLCDLLISECPRLIWTCETRADLIDDELIVHMKKAGCSSIFVGIESGSNTILEKMRKGITVEQSLSAVNIIRKHGIKLTAFFLIGTPWETRDTLRETFAVMKKIKGLLGYSIFTPYPGTEAFDYCRREGLITEDYDPNIYNHQSPENCFCMNLRKEEFRKIASEIEKYVDRNNSGQRLGNFLSRDTLRAVHNYGIKWSLKILIDMIRARLG